MLRMSTLLFIFLGLCLGAGLFQLKYLVMGLEKKAKALQTSVKETQERIHLLKAEWSHLNTPQRLQNLSERFLTVGPLRPSQILLIPCQETPYVPKDTVLNSLPSSPSVPAKMPEKTSEKTGDKTLPKEVVKKHTSKKSLPPLPPTHNTYDKQALEKLMTDLEASSPLPRAPKARKAKR